MQTSLSRLELRIDVLDKVDQRALALPDLLPGELVQAILNQFHELEYLGNDPQQYHLVKSADGTTLDQDVSLGHQLESGDRLAMAENVAPSPPGAESPSQPIYLRELALGQVFRLNWLPAIIGRLSESQPMNELVAVDLQSFSTGQSVSRRHVKITGEDGQYYVENLSSNPVLLLTAAALEGRVKTAALTGARVPLHSGDIIRLERSGIAFMFIVRQPVEATAPAATELEHTELTEGEEA
jgi:hypothetical protein